MRAPTIATAVPVEQVEVALGDQQRRRILELGEQPRIEPLAERQIPRAELLDPRDLALGLARRSRSRRLAAAAPRKVGNGVERRRRAAEARDQLAIGDRPDAGRADQPQAVDQIFDQAFALPMRGSVPAVRRRIFSRCFQRTSTAKPSSIGKSDESKHGGADRRAERRGHSRRPTRFGSSAAGASQTTA